MQQKWFLKALIAKTKEELRGNSPHSVYLNQWQNFLLHYSRRVVLRNDDFHHDTFDEVSVGDVDVKTVATVFHASLQHLEKTITQEAEIIDHLDLPKLADDSIKQHFQLA